MPLAIARIVVDLMDFKDVEAVHLDPVGGIAGDMFAAAMLDALPAAWHDCEAAIAAVKPPPGVTATVKPHSDGVLTGRQFTVDGVAPHRHGSSNDRAGHDHHHGHSHDHDHNHDHRHDHAGHHPWQAIRARLEAAPLRPAARAAAIEIFSRLAAAEATVHGIAPDDVTFHEVGAWDSIVDIVAAEIITLLPDCAWSVGTLPRGSGLVRTAHGMLPVPAPATVELLKGFDLFDDGESGERITPTGAAILSYLSPRQTADRTPRKLMATGTGFGTKRLKHRSNILRATCYGAAATSQVWGDDLVEVLRFEIDDQTAEDLAIGLEKIRRIATVLDVCQWPVHAKKGRIATAVQVLARQDAISEVVAKVFDETTTLGVRRSLVSRNVVKRTVHDVDGMTVKLAQRPTGVTAKAEASEISVVDTHAAREHRRNASEKAALAKPDEQE